MENQVKEKKDRRRSRIERGIYESPLGSGIYFIYYYYRGKRYSQKAGKDIEGLNEAKRRLEIIRTKIWEETYTNKHDIPRVIFKEFAVEYLDYCKNKSRINIEWNKSGIYQDGRMKQLLPFFGDKLLGEITPRDIESYKSLRKEKVSNRTINMELATLSHFFNKAITWGKAVKNPVDDIEKLPVPKGRLVFFSEDEITNLYKNCSEHILPIVKLAISTGMRRGELLNIKWKDIDFDNGFLYIMKSKNGKSRTIPICDAAREALALVKRHPTSEYIFCNEKGKKYIRVTKGYNNALKKAGLKIGRKDDGFVFHSLRHTFASHLIMKGVDLVTVKELLGHSSLEATMIYVHISLKHKTMAIESANSVFNGSEIRTAA